MLKIKKEQKMRFINDAIKIDEKTTILIVTVIDEKKERKIIKEREVKLTTQQNLLNWS